MKYDKEEENLHAMYDMRRKEGHKSNIKKYIQGIV